MHSVHPRVGLLRGTTEAMVDALAQVGLPARANGVADGGHTTRSVTV